MYSVDTLNLSHLHLSLSGFTDKQHYTDQSSKRHDAVMALLLNFFIKVNSYISEPFHCATALNNSFIDAGSQ
jgi:hypothetical protein